MNLPQWAVWQSLHVFGTCIELFFSGPKSLTTHMRAHIGSEWTCKYYALDPKLAELIKILVIVAMSSATVKKQITNNIN
jgi:hypothetical protein